MLFRPTSYCLAMLEHSASPLAAFQPGAHRSMHGLANTQLAMLEQSASPLAVFQPGAHRSMHGLANTHLAMLEQSASSLAVFQPGAHRSMHDMARTHTAIRPSVSRTEACVCSFPSELPPLAGEWTPTGVLSNLVSCGTFN